MSNLIVDYLLILWKVFLFVLSYYGWVKGVQRILNFPISLAMFYVISLQGLILYFGAVFNLLSLSASVIYWLGIMVALVTVYFEKPWKINPNAKIVSALIIVSIFLIPAIRSKIYHNDDLAHWALLVKYLYSTNSLPVDHPRILLHYAYPPGTGLLHYYVAKTIAFKDTLMLVGHNLIYLISMFTGYSLISKARRNYHFSILLLSAYAFLGFMNLPFYSLMVDALLATVSFGAMVGLYYYRDDFYRASVYLVVVLSFLLLIKNSALFFVLAVFLMYLGWFSWTWYRQSTFNLKNGLMMIFSSGFIAFPYVYWLRFVEKKFDGLEQAKHGVSLSSYQALMAEKSLEDIQAIKKLFFKSLLNPAIPAIYTIAQIIIFSVALLIVLKCFYQVSFKKTLPALLISGVVGCLYAVGLYFTYLYSMPKPEALKLASFDRYLQTVIIFVLGIILINLIRVLQNIQELESGRVVFGLVIVLMSFSTFKSLWSEANTARAQTPYEWLVEVTHQQESLKVTEENILVVAGTHREHVHYNYEHNAIRYFLLGENVSIRNYFDMAQQKFSELMEVTDRIVILDENMEFNTLYTEYQQINH